jgi:hypothetical protein
VTDSHSRSIGFYLACAALAEIDDYLSLTSPSLSTTVLAVLLRPMDSVSSNSCRGAVRG